MLEETTSIFSEPRCEGFHRMYSWKATELVSAGSYSRTASRREKNSPSSTEGKKEEQETTLA